jgi:hypothetical protein
MSGEPAMPEVWTATPKDMQHAWCSRLARMGAHLAVRSPERHPAFLACAVLNTDLVGAARRSAPDESVQR